MSELVNRLRLRMDHAPLMGPVPDALCQRAADALEEWEKATGGLPPELVAKALMRTKWDLTADPTVPSIRFTASDVEAFEKATFEVPS